MKSKKLQWACSLSNWKNTVRLFKEFFSTQVSTNDEKKKKVKYRRKITTISIVEYSKL